MMRAIEKHLSPLCVRTNFPKGGFFIWGEADFIDDMAAFARFAVEHKKVGIIPGSAFYTIDEAKNDRHSFRLSFAKVAPRDCRRRTKKGSQRRSENTKQTLLNNNTLLHNGLKE